MNWLDVILLLPLLAGLVRGFTRGFISEVIALAVVILGVLGARWFAPAVSGAVMTLFAWPKGVCDVVGYTIIFLAIAVALSLLARLLNRFLSAIHLGWVNRIVGAAFGLCKYGLITLIAVFIVERTNAEYHYLDDAPVVKKSVLYPKMVKAAHAVLSFTREQCGQP